jgi:ABC-type uncharacterized transport system involved in gliding motility auxiliary subunit
VSIVDGLSLFGSREDGRPPKAILNLISANFAVERVPPDASEIPIGTNVLMVVHPAELAPQLESAIADHVAGGGPALVFVDPLAETSAPDSRNPAVPEMATSAPEELLAAWGVAMDANKVVGDRELAIQTVGFAGNQRVVAPYLPWLRIAGDALAQEQPVTSQLQVMRMSSTGALEPVSGSANSIVPLIRSSPSSMLLDQSTVMRRVDPNSLLEAFEPSGERLILAARIDGPITDEAPLELILVADTDMLDDSHVAGESGRLNSSNADFVLNSIETLAGASILAAIRGSGISYRPFDRILDIQTQAEQTYRPPDRRTPPSPPEVLPGPPRPGWVTLVT